MIEPPPPLPFEPHPLVALPQPLQPGAIDLPQACGQARQTGALSQSTLQTTQAIAEALFSNEGQAPPPERMQWLMAEYADFMSRANARGRFMFTAAAWAISVAAPLLGRRWPPYRKLGLAQRITCLQALDASALSPLLLALKAILCMIYYEHPDPARDAGMNLGPKVQRDA